MYSRMLRIFNEHLQAPHFGRIKFKLSSAAISSVKLGIRMDTFVKGENEMWKMPAKERIQTRIVAASAVKLQQQHAGLSASTFGLSSSYMDENALLMSEVRGEWADWLEMIERQQ